VHREKGRVQARHLTGSDADRRAAASEDDGVGLHARHRPPGEQEVGALLLRGHAPRHHLPRLRAHVRGGALLHEHAAPHALEVECAWRPPRPPLEHTKVLLAAEDLHRVLGELRRDQTFHEQTRDRLGRGHVHRDVEGDHRAEG
jgi:hypothetical protein